MGGKQAHSNKRRSLAVLNLAAIVEKCDEQILSAVFFFLGRSLHASLPDLGMLTLCRAVVQALASPLSGILCTTLDRTFIIAIGCILWGTMASAIGLCTNLTQAMFACGLNGLGLALVVPTLSSLIADSTSASIRGKAFGAMGLTASLGGMAGALFATNMGATAGFWGIAGWRWAFHAVAVVAFFTAWLVRRFAIDPGFVARKKESTNNEYMVRELEEKQTLLSTSNTEINGTFTNNAPSTTASATGYNKNKSTSSTVWYSIRSVLRIPSFQVIVLQGIVGSIPWQAMAMLTLYLQLLNFSNFQSSILTAIFTFGCALGGLMGGVLGDITARKAPAQGRIYVCQLSVFLGIPLSWLLLKGLALPTSTIADAISFTTHTLENSTEDNLSNFSSAIKTTTGSLNSVLTTGTRNLKENLEKESIPLSTEFPSLPSVLLYAIVLLIMGLCISWCGCNNSALFAELVPEEQRTHVYAFDRSFEGAIGACGAPLVGIAAEKIFGFQGSMAEAAKSVREREKAATALSSALLLCLIVPWLLCFLSYILLHWTYPKDRGVAMKGMRKTGSEGGSLLRLVEDGLGSDRDEVVGGGGGGGVVVRKRPPSA